MTELRRPRPFSTGRRMALVVLAFVAGCTFTQEYVPLSEPVPIGTSVQQSFFTGCGLGQTVFDLDGSLWQPRDLDLEVTTPPPGVDSPNDEGTITLLSPDLAEFTSSVGGTFALVRRPGTLAVQGC